MSSLLRLAARMRAIVPVHPRHKVHTVRFRRLVRNLVDLVELSDDAADKLGGEWILDRSYVATFVARTLDRAREIVFDSAVLAGAPSSGIHARLDAVRGDLGRLMAARPTVVPPESGSGGGMAGGAHLQEPEYRLLLAAIQRLELTGSTTPAPGSSSEVPRLAEVVQEAHERALRSLEELHFEPWGRHAGRPLVGSGLPGLVRVVDVGGGTTRPGQDEWRRRVSWDRIRSTPLRALLEAALASDGNPRLGANALAVVTEEHATVRVAWGEVVLVVDACLGEHAAANFLYCALRGDCLGPAERLRAAIESEGFHRLDLGPGPTAWMRGRDQEESRRALGRLGESLGALLREPVR